MMNLRKNYDPRKPYKEQTSECKYGRPEDISQTTQSSGQILKQLNAADITKKAKQIAVESKEQQEETAQQMDMFHIAETQLADEISKLDVMAMTPIEALQTLFELQKKAKGL